MPDSDPKLRNQGVAAGFALVLAATFVLLGGLSYVIYLNTQGTYGQPANALLAQSLSNLSEEALFAGLLALAGLMAVWISSRDEPASDPARARWLIRALILLGGLILASGLAGISGAGLSASISGIDGWYIVQSVGFALGTTFAGVALVLAAPGAVRPPDHVEQLDDTEDDPGDRADDAQENPTTA